MPKIEQTYLCSECRLVLYTASTKDAPVALSGCAEGSETASMYSKHVMYIHQWRSMPAALLNMLLKTFQWCEFPKDIPAIVISGRHW